MALKVRHAQTYFSPTLDKVLDALEGILLKQTFRVLGYPFNFQPEYQLFLVVHGYLVARGWLGCMRTGSEGTGWRTVPLASPLNCDVCVQGT